MSKEFTDTWPITFELDSLEAAHGSISVIQERLYANHLVILKGIGSISVREFANFASQLGELEQPLDDSVTHRLDEKVEVLQRKASDVHYNHSLDEATTSTMRKPSSFYWHADRSFLPQPSFLTITRVVVAPETGGATDFINTEIAYELLAAEDATALKGLVGVHSYAYYHEKLAGKGMYTPTEVNQKHAYYPPVEHPLVATHPITGEPVAYISPLTLERVLGPDKDVATTNNAFASILDETKPSYYSHTWNDGEIVIWDNLGVLHRGSVSEGPRELQRVTTALPSLK
jgi:alpha-ketoglutarate-dependent taurine dioxygenase